MLRVLTFQKYSSFPTLYSENADVHIALGKRDIKIITSIFFPKKKKTKTTYVMGIHLKRLCKALLMDAHNICFCGEISKLPTVLIKWIDLFRFMAKTYAFYIAVFMYI